MLIMLLLFTNVKCTRKEITLFILQLLLTFSIICILTFTVFEFLHHLRSLFMYVAIDIKFTFFSVLHVTTQYAW